MDTGGTFHYRNRHHLHSNWPTTNKKNSGANWTANVCEEKPILYLVFSINWFFYNTVTWEKKMKQQQNRIPPFPKFWINLWTSTITRESLKTYSCVISTAQHTKKFLLCPPTVTYLMITLQTLMGKDWFFFFKFLLYQEVILCISPLCHSNIIK